MRPDRFILSTNENPNYIYCWPLVSTVTKKLFDVKVSLAFITDREHSDPLVEFFRKFGDVNLFRPLDDIPTGNQAKVTRMYLPGLLYGDEICVINDVDILPLQSHFLIEKIESCKENNLLAIGRNAYDGSAEEGKFPMIYTTAKGSVFKDLVNPMDMSYEALLNSWRRTYMFDKKEFLDNAPERFSDESLMRALIALWKGRDSVVYLPRNFRGMRAVERIDRINWLVDKDKLKSGYYIDAHLPRPLNKHMDKLKPLFEHFELDMEADYEQLSDLLS